MADPSQTRPPRGALVVIAVGLLATVAAALLSNPNASVGAVEIEWEQHAPLPDSAPAPVPGGGGQIQLVEGGLKATGRNVSGYQLFRVADVLSISKGAPVGGGRVTCTIRIPPQHTLVTHAPGNRGAYPRPSEENELIKQEVPEKILLEFNAKGTDEARVELGDAFERFSNVRGITVSWVPFEVGQQGWQWGLPQGPAPRPLSLGFASAWRTTVRPSAHISCTLATGAGTATVATAGVLPGKPQPIAE